MGHIEQIMKVFDSKEDIAHFAKCVDNDVIAKMTITYLLEYMNLLVQEK